MFIQNPLYNSNYTTFCLFFNSFFSVLQNSFGLFTTAKNNAKIAVDFTERKAARFAELITVRYMFEDKKYSVGIYTLGCKVNQYESEAIAEEFEARGFTVLNAAEVCDVYVINTCTVTSESDRKARQFIRRAVKENPQAHILVTGCFAQTQPENIAAIDGVDYICGNTDKISVVSAAETLIASHKKEDTVKICVSDIENAEFEQMKITKFDRTRAYVKIEDGCENNCTYCIIPSARGRVRSKSPDDVIAEVTGLVSNGCREVVLTGIETASYGRDLDGTDLADLLCSVDKIEGIERVRLGSLDPSLIKQDFVDRICKLKSLTPHFHLSLQSGSNRILAAMKRKYNREMALAAIERLRAAMPDVQFTTDIIVGFPGETEEDFADTVDFAKRARFINIHVFTYSKREGTLAAVMEDQIPEDVKHRRSVELSECERHIRAEILNGFVDQKFEVLFESYEDGFAYGHTASFVEVKVRSDKSLHSQIHTVRILSADDKMCEGMIVPKTKRHRSYDGFTSMSSDSLGVMKNELGLAVSVSTMRYWQQIYLSYVKREPCLDEIYLLDRLFFICGSRPECISVSSFNSESSELCSLFDDLMSKHKQMYSYIKAPCSLSDAANTVKRYLTEYTGFLKSDGIDSWSKKTGKLGNGDILILISPNVDGDNESSQSIISEFMSRHAKNIGFARKVGYAGVIGTLAEFNIGAAIDLSSLAGPDEKERMYIQSELLCDSEFAKNKILISVNGKHIAETEHDLNTKGIEFKRCGSINSLNAVFARCQNAKSVTNIQIPLIAVQKAMSKIPLDFDIPCCDESGLINVPNIDPDGTVVCSLGRAAYKEAENALSFAQSTKKEIIRIEYHTRDRNTALAAILGAYKVQAGYNLVPRSSDIICDTAFGADKIEIYTK